ncbi:unnamed protein product [Cladocopium goreaui]|uniref:Uncharacterized protein n=1 Tax=Cladocopium goreaui TaxID=2562237 RepID=A0A9P1BZN7_9DINO|nr:unnamed protein product [Cladocopium goreaui]
MGDQDSLAAICRASFPESRSWRWKLWSPNDSVWYERIRELWEDWPLSGSNVSLVAEPYGARCRSAIRTSLTWLPAVDAACLVSGAGLGRLRSGLWHRQLPGAALLLGRATSVTLSWFSGLVRFILAFDLTLGLAAALCSCPLSWCLNPLRWHYTLAGDLVVGHC